MQVRLGFAVATALEPDVLLVDEVLAVGDVRFRWKCLERVKQLKDRGVCIILVSHNSADLMRTCTRGLVMQKGQQRFDGEIKQAVLQYEGTQAADDLMTKPVNGHAGSKVSIAGIRFRVQDEYASVMRQGDSVAVEIEIDSDIKLTEARIVVGLFHAERGPLFHVSSYLDKNWISLKPGRSLFTLGLGALPIQFGSYYVEVTVRGSGLSDIYDLARSPNPLIVTDPAPNFEGFGVNGLLMPTREWTIN
jgi:lipopolysaccharide transport system ATP-binding protein